MICCRLNLHSKLLIKICNLKKWTTWVIKGWYHKIKSMCFMTSQSPDQTKNVCRIRPSYKWGRDISFVMYNCNKWWKLYRMSNNSNDIISMSLWNFPTNILLKFNPWNNFLYRHSAYLKSNFPSSCTHVMCWCILLNIIEYYRRIERVDIWRVYIFIL